MPRLDYDTIAALYDEPGRDHVADLHLAAFLSERSVSHRAVLRVLDVGCGTGKQLGANHLRWSDITFVGLDRFGGMLRIASEQCPNVTWTQGDGAALPFSSERFDYVTNQYSYPHVGNTRALLTEIFRVLRPGGRFVMTNIDPWAMPGWLIYQYFPEARALDYRDFVPPDEFVGLMRAAGFKDITTSHVDASESQTLREFRAFAVDRHRTSQLLAISDEGYAAGVRRLEDALESAPRDDPARRSEFVRITVIGDRPEGSQA